MAPGAQNVYGDPTELQQNTWGIDNKTHEIKQTARKTSLHRSYTEVRSQQEAARRKGEKATNNEKINKKSKGKNEQIQRRHDHQEKLSNFQEHLPSQESKSVIESF